MTWQVLALMALRQRAALLKRSKRIVEDGLVAVDAFFSRHPSLAHYHRPQATQLNSTQLNSSCVRGRKSHLT